MLMFTGVIVHTKFEVGRDIACTLNGICHDLSYITLEHESDYYILHRKINSYLN
jgi:hypothetical protein